METYEARLASFTPASGSRKQRQPSWPHPASFSVTPKTLAAAGFYYDPTEHANDNVTCAYCEKGLEGWENGDDALDEHLRRIDKQTGETCPWASIMGAKRDWDLFGTERAEDPECESMVSTRKGTFGSWWKFDSKKGWKPTSDKLAAAGFYNNPLLDAPDTCACIYCDVQLDGWSKNDDAETEHKQRTPDCYFFTAREQKTKKPSKNILQESRKGATKQNARASVASVSSSTATGASKGKAGKGKNGTLSKSTTNGSIASTAIEDVDENEDPSMVELTAPTKKKASKATKARSATSGRSRSSRAPSRMGESEADEVEEVVAEAEVTKPSKGKAKTSKAGKKSTAAPSVVAISEDDLESDKPAPKATRRTTKAAKAAETEESELESRAASPPPPVKAVLKKGAKKASSKTGKAKAEVVEEAQETASEVDVEPSQVSTSAKGIEEQSQTAESSADEASVVVSRALEPSKKSAGKGKKASEALSQDLLESLEKQATPKEPEQSLAPKAPVPQAGRRAAKLSTASILEEGPSEPSIVIKPPKKKAVTKNGKLVKSNSSRSIPDSPSESEGGQMKQVGTLSTSVLAATQQEEVVEDAPTPKAKSTKDTTSDKPTRAARSTRSTRSASISTRGDLSMSVGGSRTRSQSQSSVASAVSSTSAWSGVDSIATITDEEALVVAVSTTKASKGKKASSGKGKKVSKAASKGKGKQKEVAAEGDETMEQSEAESSVAGQTDAETEASVTLEPVFEAEMEVFVSPPRESMLEPQETVKKPTVEVVVPIQPSLARSVKAMPKRKSSPRQLVQVNRPQDNHVASSAETLPSSSQAVSRPQSALDALLSGPMPNFDSPERTIQLETQAISPVPPRAEDKETIPLPLSALTEAEGAMPVKDWVKMLAEQQIRQFEEDSRKLLQAWDRQVAEGRKELLWTITS